MSDQDFTVRDKRRFSPDGETKPEADGQAGVSGTQAEEARAAFEKAGDKECQHRPPLPEVNFSTFVFSLGTSALVSLGEMPDPNTNQPCQNLPLAKQTIDILGMLKEKTEGNLTEEEVNLLNHLLYDLRMKYVSRSRK